MPDQLLIIIAISCYVIASSFIARNIRSQEANQSKNSGLRTAFIFAVVAAITHGAYALNISGLLESNFTKINLSLSSMIVSVSAILILIYLLASTSMPIKRLGVLVFPLTTVSLVFAYWWNSTASYSSSDLNSSGAAFGAHVLVSVLAYALLTIATIQALLYAYLEHQIKARTNPTMLAALPPLQTMEQLLFRLVGAGFVLLSFTLISGSIFSQQLFGHAFEFKHHTILASLGWLVFAVLLFKRAKQGLRGSQAVVWTITGFLLIQLGYFGTKIISESLNVQ